MLLFYQERGDQYATTATDDCDGQHSRPEKRN